MAVLEIRNGDSLLILDLFHQTQAAIPCSAVDSFVQLWRRFRFSQYRPSAKSD